MKTETIWFQVEVGLWTNLWAPSHLSLIEAKPFHVTHPSNTTYMENHVFCKKGICLNLCYFSWVKSLQYVEYDSICLLLFFNALYMCKGFLFLVLKDQLADFTTLGFILHQLCFTWNISIYYVFFSTMLEREEAELSRV